MKINDKGSYYNNESSINKICIKTPYHVGVIFVQKFQSGLNEDLVFQPHNSIRKKIKSVRAENK